ncbi:hypothetical protein IHEIED_03327 [Methylorubrum populi]
MKWILIWTIATAQGGVTTGSAEMASLDACYAAQKNMAGLYQDATMRMGVRAAIESGCFNPATGEKKSFLSNK